MLLTITLIFVVLLLILLGISSDLIAYYLTQTFYIHHHQATYWHYGERNFMYTIESLVHSCIKDIHR